jgi:hypothetical protein
VNSRETYSNIKLITAALILTKKGYLGADEIRHALLAYTLTAREGSCEFLPLEFSKVARALRVCMLFQLLNFLDPK